MSESKRWRVLVVDDEPDLVGTLCRLLERQGYDVVGEEKSGLALQYLLESEFDLLLTDLMMPETDGLTLITAAQEIDPLIVPIVMTGQATVRTAVEAMKQGAFDYITKPFKLTELLPVLSRATEMRRIRLENLQLRESLAIYELTRSVSLTLDPQTILDRVSEAALRQCEAEEVAVRLFSERDHEPDLLSVRRQTGTSEERLTEEIPEAAVPMLVGGRVTGTLAVNRCKARRGLTGGQVKGLSVLANTAGAALENARLIEHVREAEERYRSLVENASDVVTLVSPKGVLEYVSPSVLRTLGYQPSELSGQPAPEYFHPADWPSVRKAFRQLLHAVGSTQSLEARIRHRDGTWRFLECVAKSVSGRRGGSSIIVNARDISARKLAEQRVRAQRDLVEALAHAPTLALAAQRLLQAICQDLGWDAGAFWWRSENAHALHCLAEWSCESASGTEPETTAAFRVFRRENGNVRRAWETRTVEWTHLTGEDALGKGYPPGFRTWLAVPVLFEGEALGVIEFLARESWARDEDITAMFLAIGGLIGQFSRRREAEGRLLETNRRLEQALQELQDAQRQMLEQERLRALGQMASGVAHDFNNALAPVLGYAELLLNHSESRNDPERLETYLEYIRIGAGDAAAVVRSLREFYRERDEKDVFRPVLLKRLAEQVIALTRPRWKDQCQAEGRTVQIDLRIDPTLEVIGDAAQLRELLTNLVFNALDALPQGGQIRIVGAKKENGALLEVSDSGTGMPEEVRLRCLDPFFTTKGEKGTGLGLSMVYGIIQRHEGELEIESEVGKGTAFRIRLGASPRAAQPEVERPSGCPEGLHVLVVDDDEMVRKVVVAYFEADGHTTKTAASAREALQHFQPDTFDVVITDRAMPGGSGDQLAVEIRRLAPDQPILLLTGFGDLMRASQETPEGIDVVIGKPIRPEEMRAAVAQAISARKPAPRPDSEPAAATP